MFFQVFICSFLCTSRLKGPLLAFLCTGYTAGKKIDYWNVQRKGANYFNQTPSLCAIMTCLLDGFC
ncbi:hypothetical protein [Candidatus Rhabdochlamydia sp. W815]|uniref:hypothetical protein n=1 Tax=Candidatus Rhabdochlamydia sp. W815 TaxID=2720721 RepID=UPI001BFC91DF|nr:hypothetical protein [Candidatus Rhabdochlamydia sp. W815]